MFYSVQQGPSYGVSQGPSSSSAQYGATTALQQPRGSIGPGTLFNAFRPVFQGFGQRVTNAVYGFARSNPVLYGAGVAGLSVGSGMMACSYCGMMVAGMGAAGYMNAQQAQ